MHRKSASSQSSIIKSIAAANNIQITANKAKIRRSFRIEWNLKHRRDAFYLSAKPVVRLHRTPASARELNLLIMRARSNMEIKPTTDQSFAKTSYIFAYLAQKKLQGSNSFHVFDVDLKRDSRSRFK